MRVWLYIYVDVDIAIDIKMDTDVGLACSFRCMTSDPRVLMPELWPSIG